MSLRNEKALTKCLGAGLEYILSHQDSIGSWTDWDLPLGNSSMWTTAYVGYNLHCLPDELKLRLAPALLSASRWLLANHFENGGWGYNKTAGPDADSTSCAILLLASVDLRAPEAALQHVARYQAADGGFSTYLFDGKSNSWTSSHPDVSATAVLALLTHPPRDADAVDRGIAYIVKHATPGGVWNSFWWNSFLY
jgi:squalene cyclase